MLIYLPESGWSLSIFGFTAPAYTPLIWLIGIGLIGSESFLPIPKITAIYLCFSLIFVIIHSSHTFIIIIRILRN